MPDPVAAPDAANSVVADGLNPQPTPNQEQGKGNPEPPAPQANPPVDEKASADKADPNAPLDHGVWGDAGTDNGNAILTVLQNSGVGVDDAKALLFDAMVAGDVSKIDKAALEAKVGKANATIILTGVTNEIKGRQEATHAIVSDLHTEVGGKENWTKVAEWATKNVADADLNELRVMIDAGGRQAKLAARELKALYEKADGNSSLQHAEALPGNNPPTPTSEPLSGPQYVLKLEELNKRFFGKPPENLRQALLTARQAGRKIGR